MVEDKQDKLTIEKNSSSKWKPLIYALYLLGFVGGAIANPEALSIFVFGVVVMIPLEYFFKRHDVPIWRPSMIADALHVMVTPLLSFIPLIALFGLLEPFKITWIADAITTQPHWLQIIEVLLIQDFLTYWAHRWLHTPLLWPIHAIHHSSPQLDWLAGERTHPLDMAFNAVIITVPLALTGFDLVDLLWVGLFLEVWDRTIHANLNWRLWFLRYIWVTPEYHHWHHVDRPEVYNKNLAGLFPIWDILFGTYHMPHDQHPNTYGIPGGISEDYLGQLIYPFQKKSAPKKEENNKEE
ncbi:MAG: sterol desaturase family protein [Bacteroidota bacterium]